MPLTVEVQAGLASPSGRAPALPFEKQPRESAKAFAAFQVYQELGSNRSHVQVAEKIGISKRMVHKWSSKYGWIERLAARDAYLAEVERLAIERVATEKAVESRLGRIRRRLKEAVLAELKHEPPD